MCATQRTVEIVSGEATIFSETRLKICPDLVLLGKALLVPNDQILVYGPVGFANSYEVELNIGY